MARKHRGAVVTTLLSLSLFSALVVVALLLSVFRSGGAEPSGAEIEREVASSTTLGQNRFEGKMQRLLDEDQVRQAALDAEEYLGKVRKCWAGFRYDEALAHLNKALDLCGDNESEIYEQKRVMEPALWMLGMTLRMLGEQEPSLAAMWKWVKVDNHRSAHELWWATQLYLEDDRESALEQFRQSKIDLLLTHLDSSTAAFTHYGQRCDHTMAVTYLCAQAELSAHVTHRQQLLERAAGYSAEAMSPDGSLGLIHEAAGDFEQAASYFEEHLESQLGNLNSVPDNSPVQIFFVQDALFHLQRAMSEIQDPQRQETAYRKTLATYDEKLPSWHPVGALLRMEYSDFLVEQGRPVEAEEIIAQACDMLGTYTLASGEALESAGKRWIALLEQNGKADEITVAKNKLAAALARRQNGKTVFTR